MAKLADNESSLLKELRRTLDLKKAQLEDGSIVTNKEAICQVLMEKALKGDLAVIDLIVRILNRK